jgi:uncharacterized protein (TIGR03437 family)
VVNAASYAAGIGPALGSGSIGSIFGTNLAASTQVAQTVPLPIQLGGTSVSVYGIAAPLFYVSPTQINFQVPSPYDVTPGASSAAGIVVSTAVGESDPYQFGAGVTPEPGIFTLNASGCGPGAVLNVSGDGSVSVNSSTNSALPGQYISIYGTGGGLVYNTPPDGTPAPISPLAPFSIVGGPVFDFSLGFSGGPGADWGGRAPGMVGVDQYNFTVPTNVREGCAVPLQMLNQNLSRPVTISIASGGGPCADPPTQGYGQVLWEKTVTTSAANSVTEADTVTVSLQASPGRQAPTPPVFTEGGQLPQAKAYFGPSCPIPGYRSLDAGTVTAKGPGLAAVPAPAVPLPGSTVFNWLPEGGYTVVSQVQSGQVRGLTEYQATLPSGTIQPGSFTVSAGGGADVGAFQSTIQIGSPIQVTTALAGATLVANGQPITINWTGGDPNAWVTLKLVGHAGPYDFYPFAWVARASDGSLSIKGLPYPSPGFAILGPVDVVMEVVPDPSQVQILSVPGLSLGGTAQWKYTYRFEGATVTQTASNWP